MATNASYEIQDWILTLQQLPEENFLMPSNKWNCDRSLAEQDLTLEDLLKQLDGS